MTSGDAKHPVPESRRRRPRLTVGHWLFLLIAAFFIGPLSMSNLWGYLQTRSDLTTAAFRNIRNVAALEAAETREFVRAAENLIPSIVAGNQHLFGLLEELGRSDVGERRHALRHDLESHLRAKASEGESVEEFSVLSPTGMLLASSSAHRHGTRDHSATACFRVGRERAGIAGFEYPEHEAGAHDHDDSNSHGEDEPQLVVAAPIRHGGGALLGVFCARFGFHIHRSLLVAHKERTSLAALYLLDENGRVVCGSFEDLSSAPYGEQLARLEESVTNTTEEWQGRYHSDSGEEFLLSFAPIPALGWGLLVEVPVKRALADLERLKWQAMAASALLASVLMLAAFLSWRMVVRPIQALSHTSDRMASGAPGETVAPRGPREVVELATAFNRMSLALRDSQEMLETRIGQRTHALRESQEFLELLLDSLDHRVVVVDRDYRIIKANAAAERMHGRDLVGACSYEVFEGAPAPPADYPARRTFETGDPVAGERSQLTIHGREPVNIETYPVFDAGSRVVSVVEIARVVTAEKQLQLQMVHREKMAAFGQLAAGVAHEIGNPLAAIESQLRMAQDDPSRADETIEVVGNQVRRIARMLRELVDFTRRRRGETMLVSVNQVIEDTARLIDHDPRARTVAIVRRLADNLPGVRTKEDHLVQVFVNLGLNALDAMSEQGELEFQTGMEDGLVTIRIRDTGAGMTDEVRAHLFEPFFTSKAHGRGTGLGLFISKGIVESMGGRLDLESTGPEGTTFVIRLPVEHPETGRAAS